MYDLEPFSCGDKDGADNFHYWVFERSGVEYG